MLKSNQFWVCELIFVCIFYTYTRFVKLPSLTKHNVCYDYADYLHVLCHSHIKTFIEPSVRPKQPRLEPGWLLCIWRALQQSMYHIQFITWTMSRLSAHLSENVYQQIIDKSIEHWRDKLKVVVRLNDGHTDYLVHLLSCSYVAFMRFAIVYWALRWYCDKKLI